MFVESFVDFRNSADIIGYSGTRKRYVLSEDESTLQDYERNCLQCTGLLKI
jgi:hypothetical protein